ncbi:MAG: SDR family NAD(P)-dependent oxidoreductase [Alphaproteobacteria bacterium]
MPANLFDIRDHVAIVTGAASGLGYAITEVLAEHGARVAMADIDRPGVQEAAAKLSRAGCAVAAIPLDVTDTAALRAAIDGVAGREGRLDIMFANAGISSGAGFGLDCSGGIAGVDRDAWDRVLATNLTSVFESIRAASIHMVPRKRGRIIVTASIAGIRAEPLVGYPYIAAKAAVANLVRQVARELGPHNVLVNAIAPGSFLTNIAGGRLKNPEVARRWAALAPLGRIADAHEIKGLALYLASPASSYMTGAVIPIDGGATA